MIFRRLLPRQGKFYELFNEHGARIGAGAQAFLALVEHYDDPVRRAQHAAEVDSAERSADRVTAEVVRSLHRTVFTPIGRDQILGLINAMDDVLDLLQDCTETLSLYDVRALPPEAVQLATISVRCCERVQHALTLLPNLRDRVVAEAAMKTCEEIDRLESDADRVMRSAMSQLFREQPDVRELIKLKAVYELLESISDRCEDVANLIEGVVIENS